MKKSLNSILILLFIAGTFLFLFGCGENKTIIPAEKDLPADLSPQVKAALLEGLYSLEDLARAKKLIEEGKAEERVVPSFKFLVESGRFEGLKRYGKNNEECVVVDAKNIANIFLFDTLKEEDVEKTKAKIMRWYSEKQTDNFNQFVVSEVTGKFFPNIPSQEVTIYKLKCFINGHVRYLTVIHSEFNGRRGFAVISNRAFPNSKMGDVVALFLKSLQQMPPSS